MKSALPSSSRSDPSSGRSDAPGTAQLGPALERQRRQQELRDTLEAHAGALDIERLIGTLPDGRSEAGQTLRRSLRQHGRYVRLSLPLGRASSTWKQSGRPRLWPVSRVWPVPGAWPVPRIPTVSRVLSVLGWLEQLSGVRFPVGEGADLAWKSGDWTLEPGGVALTLPAASGGLLLAERQGRLYQYLQPVVSAEAGPEPAEGQSLRGQWRLLESVADLQTGSEAQADEQALGLERLPDDWMQLSSARRGERAGQARLVIAAAVASVLLLLGSLLTHAGLMMLIGPLLLGALLLAAGLDRRFSVWVQQGSALKNAPARAALTETASPVGGALQQGRLVRQERLLSPETRARLAALRDSLASARTQVGAALTDPVLSELSRLLEDRFSYPYPDPALDTLLEGQVQALEDRLAARLDLDRQRARDLAAERLRRESVDPHF